MGVCMVDRNADYGGSIPEYYDICLGLAVFTSINADADHTEHVEMCGH